MPIYLWLRRVVRVGWDAYWRFTANDGWAIASHIALSALLAIFPFLILVTALAGFLGLANLAGQVVDLLFAAWPDRVVVPIRNEITFVLGSQRLDLLTIGGALMLWFASSGVEAVRVGLNRAYGEQETRWWFQTRAQSMLFVVVGAAGLLALAFLIVLAPAAFQAAEALFPDLAPSIHELQSRILTSRYGITALILLVALLVAHLFLPAGRRRLLDVVPGILVTLGLWIVAASAFAYYLASFANYTRTYAGFASVMIALVFLYFVAVIFILGGELNAAWLRSRQARAAVPAPVSSPTSDA
jgi:membrane protein